MTGWPSLTDSVEEVGRGVASAGLVDAAGRDDEWRGLLRWRGSSRGGDQLGQFPQVLGGGGEQELVAGAGGSAEPEAIETQDAL